MRLKKGVKRALIIIALVIIVALSVIIYLQINKNSNTPKEITVVNEIKEYGYTLKSNKSKKYQELFRELEKILKKEKVDEEAYVKKISEMFIVDFFTLSNKVANTDVGGTDFVHSAAKANFLLKAEDTMYKYVQSNIYGNRNQELPTVDEVKIESVEKTEYALGDTNEEAYQVTVSWTYEDENDYQKEATLIYVHEGKVLSLVEME